VAFLSPGVHCDAYPNHLESEDDLRVPSAEELIVALQKECEDRKKKKVYELEININERSKERVRAS